MKNLRVFNILFKNCNYNVFSLNTNNFKFQICRVFNFDKKEIINSHKRGLNSYNQDTPTRILPKFKIHPTRILPKSKYTRPIFRPNLQIYLLHLIVSSHSMRDIYNDIHFSPNKIDAIRFTLFENITVHLGTCNPTHT